MALLREGSRVVAMSGTPRFILLSVVAAVVILGTICSLHVEAFKAGEFKKCQDAHFCKRNRDRAVGSSGYSIMAGKIVEGRYVATLGSSGEPGVELSLVISAYDDATFRIKVNEHVSKGRFEVPDVVEPEFELKRVSLNIDSTSADFTWLHTGAVQLHVLHSPLQITAFEGGEPVITINNKGLFNFEHHREKQEGDEVGLWDEHFKSHHDSKPKGPEAISFDVSFLGATHVYGIPEHATSLALKPTKGPGIQSEPYRLYNLDVFEYEADSPFGLYGSIPVMISHNTRRTAGFFWLNAAEMFVDVLAPGWEGGGAEGTGNQIDTHWIAESGIFDGFIFLGPSPKAVVRQYTSATGKTAMPQLFSIAYHQCRWNYKDEADVTMVDTKFDFHDIPYDVLWLDIEHTDGKKYMTWDHNHFPTPERMQEEIKAKGRHMVTIVDPHMKRDEGYGLHKESTQKGYYVKDKNGNDFDGWCWPGSSSYLDMLSPEIRKWWATKFSYESYEHSTPVLYIWNDMNEPSVFNGPEVTMPKDNIHYGGVEHRDVHNAYGYYYHLASAQGLLQRGGGTDRPFVLSRAVFAGSQKVGPIWTGDNTADWDHLRVSIPMLLTMGLAGMANSGADVGGFFADPNGELMTRWFQLGAFYPFFRGHAHLDTKRREPWIFGEPYTSHIREAIRTRYALLPYVYTLFREAATIGTPLMRPLWMEFPHLPHLLDSQRSFMLGPALLVTPVLEEGATAVTVDFPGEDPWYHVGSGQVAVSGEANKARSLTMPVSLETVPVFQRGGTIIVRKERGRRSTAAMAHDPYTLVVALNASRQAEGEFYLDDGKSYEYKTGAFLHRRFIFAEGRLHSMDASGGVGVFSSPCVVERVVVMGAGSKEGRGGAVDGGKEVLEEEMGPAIMRPGQVASSLIVRRPNVNIGSDWNIQALGS